MKKEIRSEVQRRLKGRGAVATPLTALAAVLGCAGSPAAYAQQQPAAQTNSGEIEEIVVSARFRNENIQQTPIAISAISADMLQARGATNVVDIGNSAPNVVIDALGAGFGPTLAASIRGLSLGDFKAVFEAPVPIYVDDVVLARPTGAIMDLLDLERVEVLRGPQGTLFGKNAVGGVIRLISKKPDATPEASLEGTIGNFNRLEMRASYNTALNDTMFTRWAFSAKRRDGFVDVLDFACQMRANGTPQLAGIGDGIVGWNTTTNTPITGVVNSAADNAFSLPTQTSARGTNNGCLIDTMGDESLISGRGAFRWLVNDRVEVNLTADLSHQSQKGPADFIQDINPTLGLLTTYNNTVARPRWGVPYDRRFLTGNPRTIYSTFDDPISGIKTPNVTNLKAWGASATLDWKVRDGLDAKFILGYRTFDSFFGRDSDGSPMNLNHTLDTYDNDQFTAEARLSGQAFGGRTDWTVGGFYFDAKDFNSNISILFPFPGFGQGNIDRIDDQNTKNYAGFVHTVSRLTDQLTLTAGVRYTSDEKDVLQTRVQRDGVTFLFPPTALEVSASRVSPMVNLSYQFTDELMSYAGWQRGFRGGGFNPRPAGVSTLLPFGPEDLDSFEVGVKSDLFDRRLRVNAAAFFMIYKDLQLPSIVSLPGGAVSFPPQNVGKAHLPGVELEILARPTRAWTIDGSVGYLGFDYQDLGAADPEEIRRRGGVVPASGQPCLSCRSIRAPEWTGALGSAYEFGMASGASLLVRADLSYQSQVFYTADNVARASQGAYSLLNARATWTNAAGDLTVSVFGTNLTNQLYAQGKLDFLPTLATVQSTFGRPAEWGMSIRRRF
jgi:iron complex outermembrane recepter protein